ncbi:hypothetical protein AZ28_0887, partial [Bordetella pertussis B200]
RSHLPELPTPSRCHEILATPLQLASTPPRHRARCTHLQTQPGRIQPIDSSHLGGAARRCGARRHVPCIAARQRYRRPAHGPAFRNSDEYRAPQAVDGREGEYAGHDRSPGYRIRDACSATAAAVPPRLAASGWLMVETASVIGHGYAGGRNRRQR